MYFMWKTHPVNIQASSVILKMLDILYILCFIYIYINVFLKSAWPFSASINLFYQ